MSTIQPAELPREALLNKYRREGAYTDCYVMDVAGAVPQAAYVEAFYTTALFKAERLILSLFAAKPSSDAQVKQLASGEITDFAAWSVEGRCANQLLLCDYLGRTRSWLMIDSVTSNDGPATRLYFGSAVVPARNRKTGKGEMGLIFRALLGFHKLYSVALLRAAVSRLHTIGAI